MQKLVTDLTPISKTVKYCAFLEIAATKIQSMPSSAVRTFTDPNDYAPAIRQGTHELTLTERGDFSAKLTRIDLHRLRMQRFNDNLSRISHVAGWGGRAVIAFRTEPGPSLVSSGVEIQPTNIVRYAEGQNYYRRSSGNAAYGTMSLPIDEIAAVGETTAAGDLTPPRDAMLITPPQAAMARLQRLHTVAGQLAEDTPEIIAHPEAARGLEQALIEAMVACLASGERREKSFAQGQHAIVMRRFRRVVEENSKNRSTSREICKAIRVSDRTLRVVCQEHLGMGPKHYLMLRRMHLGRSALRHGVRDQTLVTDAAMRFGFWQLGRFAVEYQSLFGESPSATLRQ